jgi:hypothetical protein
MIQCSQTEARHYLTEVLRCRKSFVYFCDNYCQILADSGQGGTWVPFRLWPEQRRVAGLLQANRLVVVLKARQLGLTWLVVAFALWLMLFHPIATVLLFSHRDDEAVDLLATRLRPGPRPQPGRQYVIGADPAEGNPNSDDSALEIIDAESGEEVATLAGRFEPTVFANYAAQLAGWFNNAPVLCERNNHGHLVIARLADHGATLLCGRDGREGWMSSTLGKVAMYDAAAQACKNKDVVIHSFVTFTQLASIDGSTLRAPEGQHDDLADAFALACAARLQMPAADDDYFEPVLGSSGFQPCNYPGRPFMGGW